MSKISVIMSTYKEPIEWVARCIESIVNQTLTPNEFVIIVDCPTNQGMISLIKDYEKRYDFIKLFVNEENIGLVRSLNKALSLCSGDIIARMDADDFSEIDRFEKQLAYMNRHNADIVGSGYYIFYDDSILDKRFGKSNDVLCKKMLQYSTCIAHPTWFVKKDLYNRLGGYREIDACEDLDFLIRAAMDDAIIGAVKEQLLWYRDNPKSISHKKIYEQQTIKDYLCDNYRKKKQTTIEMYNAFLNSDLFDRRVEAYSYIDKLTNELSICRSNLLKRIILKIRLYSNIYFITQKFKNQLLNNIIRKYE